jgi:hypothetical protein
MKSFRLDRNSVSELLATWPAALLAIALLTGLAYVGWFHVVARILFIGLGALYWGFVFRGRLHDSLRQKYPHAQALLLLAIALVTLTLGVVVRMTFPAVQGGVFDLVWLSTAFCFILAFVVVNRRDRDVVK